MGEPHSGPALPLRTSTSLLHTRTKSPFGPSSGTDHRGLVLTETKMPMDCPLSPRAHHTQGVSHLNRIAVWGPCALALALFLLPRMSTFSRVACVREHIITKPTKPNIIGVKPTLTLGRVEARRYHKAHTRPLRRLLHKVHLPFRGPWPRASPPDTKPTGLETYS